MKANEYLDYLNNQIERAKSTLASPDPYVGTVDEIEEDLFLSNEVREKDDIFEEEDPQDGLLSPDEPRVIIDLLESEEAGETDLFSDVSHN